MARAIALSAATTGLHPQPGAELDGVDGEDVRGVGHRQVEERPGARERKHAVGLAVLARHEREDLARHLQRVEVVGRGEAVLLRHEVGDLALGDVAQGHERGAEATAVGLLDDARLVQLLRGDDAGGQGEVADADGHGCLLSRDVTAGNTAAWTGKASSASPTPARPGPSISRSWPRPSPGATLTRADWTRASHSAAVARRSPRETSWPRWRPIR